MKLNDSQIQEKLAETTGWERRDQMIVRMFQFEDFKESMSFVNKVADLADEMDHHPDILISYNSVQLSLTTHSEGGLTDNDFKLAGKINNIA